MATYRQDERGTILKANYISMPMMESAANQSRLSRLWKFAMQRPARLVGLIFVALMAIQALGFWFLGTGQAGCALSESILVVDSLLAMFCAWRATRRAQGLIALFWSLFVAALMVLLVPTAIQAYQTLTERVFWSDSTWALLYCLYGAPILMMLFLPDSHGRSRIRPEIFLDIFQIAVVVALVYSTFFFLPLRQLQSGDALLHDVSVSDKQSLILLFAVLVRLRFVRLRGTRELLLRLGLFLLICAIATFIGDWLLLHQHSVALAWFDIGWALPQACAALVALTWHQSPEQQSAQTQEKFISFLGTNLVLVAMLSSIHLLMDRWKHAYGETLADAAIAASLVAFTFRLAITQFQQRQELAQRREAQKQLASAHERTTFLLDDARRQTAEITMISELGSLLQACATREEVFRLIPDRLRRLFPGASGGIALLSASKTRVESAAEWGITPVDRIFSPGQCWALRRGCTHVHFGGSSDPRCSHLLGDGPSICIPLITSGEAIGTLTLQEDECISASRPAFDVDSDAVAFTRRQHLAAAVAEHIAIAVSNLNLRESLRLQAVRDPLTGLYNRRYMQEFLDRELHSARRKNRPLAVMMLDLDHFKRYNDNLGHSKGDQALAAVGATLMRSVRADDVACRYGGEEFALILPECSLLQATVRAEDIRKQLRACSALADGQTMDVLTVSIGVAAFDETTDRADLLLTFADNALYQAKRDGRDRVVVARPASLQESGSPVTGPASGPAKDAQPRASAAFGW